MSLKWENALEFALAISQITGCPQAKGGVGWNQGQSAGVHVQGCLELVWLRSINEPCLSDIRHTCTRERATSQRVHSGMPALAHLAVSVGVGCSWVAVGGGRAGCSRGRGSVECRGWGPDCSAGRCTDYWNWSGATQTDWIKWRREQKDRLIHFKQISVTMRNLCIVHEATVMTYHFKTTGDM